MIDLILLLFVIGVFYGGFWCGSKYNTILEMFRAISKMFD